MTCAAEERNMARVFSGVQPTADIPHLGNYIGAFRYWPDLQREHEALFCVVDLHTLTVPWDPKVLAERTRRTAAVLMACGIDPERSVLFVQSEVPQHTELSWILTCIARMGELGRMTQFKEKSAGKAAGAIGAGLIAYPVLMAADILAYRASLVPVGDDQRQHVELARNLTERFNRQFGETFPLPEPLIAKTGDRIMSLDDPLQKMDKSSTRPASVIWMNDGADAVRGKIAKAVTDSGSDVRYGEDKPAISNLLDIFSAAIGRPVADIEQEFAGKGYAAFKAALADAVIALLDPFRARLEEILADRAQLDGILDAGAAKAADLASETLAIVRERVGFRK